MKGNVFLKKAIAAICAGIVCIAAARTHTIVTSESGYTDPEGNKWKYKKSLSGIEGLKKLTYLIYTNEKNIRFEDVYITMNGDGTYIVCRLGGKGEGSYGRFYLMQEAMETIPTPTPSIYYTNKAGTEFNSEQFATIHQLCERNCITEDYFEKMNQNEVDILLSDEFCYGIYEFDYKEDMDAICNNDTVYSDGFVFQDKKDVLEIRKPKQGQLPELFREVGEEILRRAEKEKKEDFDYYGIQMYHAVFGEGEAEVDFQNKLVRVRFGEENSTRACFVYIGFDGLTRKVVQKR